MTKKKPGEGGTGPFRRVVARNKRARHDYHLVEEWEAGVVLVGSEVKTLRGGKGSIAEAYARMRGSELWLLGANIPEYREANRFNHEPTRDRKLLLHRQELRKLEIKLRKGGCTVVPTEIYFDERGKVKVRVALATGKRQHDKRQDMRTADAQRDLDRVRKAR